MKMLLEGLHYMNQKQLQYAIKLSETLNISHVAEQLNISQPALSKQILSLENELGLRLFDRSCIPMKLTPAGEYFFKEAQKIMYEQEQLVRSMEKFKSGEIGRLVIGISPFRSLYLMPFLANKINEKFPGIQIFLNEVGSDVLRKDVADGKYDFAIVNLPVNESVLETIPLEADTLVLAVPNQMMHHLPFDNSDNLTEIDFADCRDLPFISVGQSQELRLLFENLCAQANITPKIFMEVVGITTAWAMANAGLGATLLPLQFIKGTEFNSNVTLFKIKDNNFLRQPAIVTRKGQYLSDYAKYAIKILTEAF